MAQKKTKQGNHKSYLSHDKGAGHSVAEHAHHEGAGIDRKLHDPVEDRLIPLAPLDLGKIESIDDLVRAMSKTAFTGRQLGEAADVLEAMARDQDAFVVMTLAGAMTVAKQGLIIAELIERGIVNAIVSTGALMAHGLVEATGRAHFRHNPDLSDEELYEAGYNRVYDTLEPEQNLDDVERVMHAVFSAWDAKEVMCSYKLNRAIGAHLSKTAKGQRGILKSAYENNVPVFVPAFSDSELGLDYALTNRERDKQGKPRFRFDPSKTWSTLPPPCSPKSGSVSSPSAVACRATGRSSSAPSSSCAVAAAERTCRSSAITTACASALSRSIGADFRAVPIAKPCHGASSCLQPKAASLARSWWMRP